VPKHLENAVRALLASEGWARWVRVRSRNGLSRYSWSNEVQIAAQREAAHCLLGVGGVDIRSRAAGTAHVDRDLLSLIVSGGASGS
jgi:hypothetical protein